MMLKLNSITFDKENHGLDPAWNRAMFSHRD